MAKKVTPDWETRVSRWWATLPISVNGNTKTPILLAVALREDKSDSSEQEYYWDVFQKNLGRWSNSMRRKRVKS